MSPLYQRRGAQSQLPSCLADIRRILLMPSLRRLAHLDRYLVHCHTVEQSFELPATDEKDCFWHWASQALPKRNGLRQDRRPKLYASDCATCHESPQGVRDANGFFGSTASARWPDDGPNHKPSIVYCWAPLDCGPRRLETALRVGVPVMTSTLAFSLIAAFLMLGVIADSWGRRFRR